MDADHHQSDKQRDYNQETVPNALNPRPAPGGNGVTFVMNRDFIHDSLIDTTRLSHHRGLSGGGGNGLHDRAPARARRPAADSAQREDEHRRHRHRRHGRRQPGQPRGREYRRPVRRRSCLRRTHHPAVSPGEDLQGLSPDAGKAEGHRRRGDRHARSYACRDRHGGHQGRQARLLPETADAHGLRSPHARPGGQGAQGRHADGHPGPQHGRPPADLRVGGRGPDRRGPRGRCLVQPFLLSLGPRRLEQFVVGPAQGNAARARLAGLGPVDRPGGDAAVPSGVPSGDVALLLGFRLRDDGRPRGAHARCGGLGLETRPAQRASRPPPAGTRRRCIRSRRSSPSASPRGKACRR